MLDSTWICFGEVCKTLDEWNKRDAVVARGIDDGVEVLGPPIVLIANLFSQCQPPCFVVVVFLNPFDGSVEFDQVLIVVSINEIFNVLLNHCMVSKWCVHPVPLDRQ